MRTYISFVIPAKNESGSVEKLFSEIKQLMKRVNKSYEIIFIDDGSTDKTFDEISKLAKKSRRVRAIKLRGNWGKSVALQVGFEHARGDIVFTMDADLQDNPKEIPRFLEKIDEGYDLVSGWKKTRHDPITKVIPSRILNKTTALFTGLDLHDINCGYKAYRREVIEELNLYGELYRFIPIFAFKSNFRVAEIPVAHRQRRFGKTKYGWERNIKGLLDLLTVVFLTGYTRRPGHFFGFFGLLSFGAGFSIGLYITYLRVTTGSIQYRHPFLFFGMLLMIMGVQLVSTGLMAEMILSNRSKTDYSKIILERIN